MSTILTIVLDKVFFSFSPAQFPHVDLITTGFTLFRQTRRQKKPKIKSERCVLSQQSESKEKKYSESGRKLDNNSTMQGDAYKTLAPEP